MIVRTKPASAFGSYQIEYRADWRANRGFVHFFRQLESEVRETGAARFAAKVKETAQLALDSDLVNRGNFAGLLKIFEWGAFILERNMGAYKEAAECHLQCASIQQRLGNLYAHRNSSIGAFRNLCYAAQKEENGDAAISLIRQAFSIRTEFERKGDFWETHPFFYPLKED